MCSKQVVGATNSCTDAEKLPCSDDTPAASAAQLRFDKGVANFSDMVAAGMQQQVGGSFWCLLLSQTISDLHHGGICTMSGACMFGNVVSKAK